MKKLIGAAAFIVAALIAIALFALWFYVIWNGGSQKLADTAAASCVVAFVLGGVGVFLRIPQ